MSDAPRTRERSLAADARNLAARWVNGNASQQSLVVVHLGEVVRADWQRGMALLGALAVELVETQYSELAELRDRLTDCYMVERDLRQEDDADEVTPPANVQPAAGGFVGSPAVPSAPAGGLLPCPFCGTAQPDYPSNLYVNVGGFLAAGVSCASCGVQILRKTREEANEAWNRRPAPPADPAATFAAAHEALAGKAQPFDLSRLDVSRETADRFNAVEVERRVEAIRRRAARRD